jgi:hypothetical protein
VSWFPSIHLMPATLSGDDGEYEGWLVELAWGRWVVELTIARAMPEIGL